MAHELGYFKKFGIESVVSKEASWAVIRDKMNLGENQGTHMLIGMPLASTMGLAGSPVKPMVIPWLLNRNGQAITLNNKLKQAGVKGPKGCEAAGRSCESGRRSADVRDDVPARHARDVDALLAGQRRHPSRQGRHAHHDSAAADGREHEGRQDGRLLRRRAVERAGHRRRHRLHVDHHAADVARPSGKGLRVHRGVRDEEPEVGEGGAQGAASGERRARQARQPAEGAPRSSRVRRTSIVRRRSSSAVCSASTNTATAARNRTRTT